MIPLMFIPGESYETFFDGAPSCTGCHVVDDPEWVSPTFSTRRTADAFYTNDMALLISERFRSHYQNLGARYIPLPADPQHFRMIVDPIVAVDTTRSPPNIEAICEVCGRSARYPFPKHLISEETMPKGFCRADLQYGGWGPGVGVQLTIVYVDAATAARLRRLKHCRSRPIRD